MQVFLKERNFELKDHKREQIDQKVQHALDRFQERIQRVDIVIADENGPRGGPDKHCKLHLKLEQWGDDIYTSATGEDSVAAVSKSLERAISRLIKIKEHYKHH